MGASRSAGYTLVEVLVVVVLVAILAALAYPRLDRQISRVRTTGTLDRFAADLHYARMLAVRSGRSVVVRTEPASGCPSSAQRSSVGTYRIVVRETPERIVKHVPVGEGMRQFCLEMNGRDSLVFNSRGLLTGFMNRTVWARHHQVRDSLTVSTAGRILRRF